MITDTEVNRFPITAIRRALIAGLILTIAVLIAFSSMLPSAADILQMGTSTPPKTTATPSGPELVEVEGAFTVGDIGQFAHPPSLTVQRVELDGTVVVVDEGFEGSWPPSVWAAQPNWGASSCRVYAGSKSAWVEGSAGLACGSDYVNDENAFLIYGPLSLADATAASLTYQLWLDTYGGDYLCSMASVSGLEFHGICSYGASNGWVQEGLDLTGVPALGNLAGQPAVWIALVWSTNRSSVKPEGAFVDEVQITKTVGGPTVTPTSTGSPTRTPGPTTTPLPTPVLGWHIETVYTNANGETGSIDLDSADRPHISFQQGFESILKLARWDGTTWRIESVSNRYWEGEYSSLKLDIADRPRVAFYSGHSYGNDKDLIYSHWDGSAWQRQVVDSDGDVGKYPSLALDRADHPHIVYHKAVDWQQGELKYAHWDGSAWHVDTVDSGASYVGQYASLALDSAGHPHISYSYGDFSRRQLKYARWDGSTWRIQVVDNADDVGSRSSLALDAADHPHFIYYDFNDQSLEYAHWDGSSWHTEAIDSTGGEISLALDRTGSPHVSYGGGGVVKYARRDEGSWHSEVVEAGRECKGISLALDTAGRPRISYLHDDDTSLLLAQWSDTPLPPTPTPTGTPRQPDSHTPELAPAAGGGAIAVWNDDRFDPSTCCDVDVMARRFGPDGNPAWSSDVRVSRTSGWRNTSPAVISETDGDSFVVWQNGGNIYTQKLDAVGRFLWSADMLVYGWPSNAEKPRIALDRLGNRYVLWRTYWDACYGAPCPTIQLMKSGPAAWGEVNIVRRPGYELELAVTSNGESRLVWREGKADEDSNIFGLSLAADGHWRWPNPVRINSDTGAAPQAHPRVEVDAAGNTYFVWADKRDGNWDIYAQKFDVNVGHRLWADDVCVNSDTGTADQVDPDLVVDADGYIYIVWADGRNGVADIYAQKLTPAGTRLWLGDLRINATSQADARSGPVITADSTGVLFIAWESHRGSQHDIFMQSYILDGTRCWSVDAPVEGPPATSSLICTLPTPTPTATPSTPWLNWEHPGVPLLVGPHGRQVAVNYGNIPAPTLLTAALGGPALFADGGQAVTAAVTSANGNHTLHLKPATGSAIGDTFTLEVTLAGLRLERVGTIGQGLYLPLVR